MRPHIAIASLLLIGAVTLPVLAQDDDLFVSFYNTDTVGLYDAQTGALLNSSFASIQDPIGLAVGPDQNLYVGSDNLSAEDAAGIAIFGINGTSSTPMGTFVTHVNDNSLNNPQGLAFSGGNLYVADITAGVIFVYNSAGTRINTLSSENLDAPSGLSLAASGALYIADISGPNVFGYQNGTLTQINNNSTFFNQTSSAVDGGDGNLYVLDPSATGGIYKLSLSDGSAQEIVNYSSSPFQASSLTLGPDGELYVSGVNLDSDEGEILQYGLDGSGGGVFVDTGFGTSPGDILIVPEPTAWSLAGLAIIVFGISSRLRLRSKML